MDGVWHYPVEIHFGPGKISLLANEAVAMGFKRVLIVIDPFLLKLDSIKKVITELKSQLEMVAIFDGIKPNPDEHVIELGVIAFREIKGDGLIVIGGGSALDSGKTIAFMSAQQSPLWDFIDEGDNYLKANTDVAKIIAIPTTSGTGAEVGRASVIKDSVKNNKFIIFHPKMQPSLVIADANLTLSVPKDLTIHTALDAFSHCLEAYLAPGFHPMADGIALEGMRLIKNNLEKAVNDGQSIKARNYLMAAAIMGATAFQKGLGAIHGLSHPVGAKYNLSHGLLNAIFMPEVLLFNEAICKDKLIHLATVLNLTDKSERATYYWLIELYQRLDLCCQLAKLGAKKEDANEIAKLALADPSTQTNPRTLSKSDYKKLFLNCI